MLSQIIIFSRLLVLKKYGGIYLDNDIYVINNLDKYRMYEFTLGWPDGEWIGNMLLMGHKDARFITQFIDTYKNYRSVDTMVTLLENFIDLQSVGPMFGIIMVGRSR